MHQGGRLMSRPRRKIDPSALKRLFGRMRPHLRPHRRTLTMAALAMIGATAMEILRPWPLKLVFDGLLIPSDQPDGITASALELTGGGDMLLAAAAIGILAIAIIGGVVAFAQAYLVAARNKRLN